MGTERCFFSFYKIFVRLFGKPPPIRQAFIAAGAGLVFKKTKDMKVIYLGRPTDPDGRIFLDRPPLLRKEEVSF